MSPDSPPTANTTPVDDNEDIWGDDGADPLREEFLSDLPTMKRQHMTDGYREGLSMGKAKVMQGSFDEGYPIGVQIGLRVGPILGVLEAYLACKSIDAVFGMREKLKAIYAKATEALSVNELLKNSEEQTVVEAKTIPGSALMTIQYWEDEVTAIYKTRLR